MKKLLLDSCIWRPASAELAAAGYDVVYVLAEGEDPGDEEILRRAHAESRILVTVDKDFGELATVRNQPHSGIVRLVGFSVTKHAAMAALAVEQFGEELLLGAVVTVEPGRIRIRPAD